MNTINLIHPYRLPGGTWAFDDPARESFAEPFVGETNRVIDGLVQDIRGAFERGFEIAFSGLAPFPGHQACFECVAPGDARDPDGLWSGCWYRLGDRGLWLCPALFRYFAEVPDRIWVRLAPLEAAGAEAGPGTPGATRERFAVVRRAGPATRLPRVPDHHGFEHLYLLAPRGHE